MHINEQEQETQRQLTNADVFFLTSLNDFFPTSLLIFQGENTCPWLKMSSTSSNVRPTVSGYIKKIWMKAAKLKVPKMKYVFHAIELKPGGTAKAKAVLNAQFLWQDYLFDISGRLKVGTYVA
jgi:hypothetical protein